MMSESIVSFKNSKTIQLDRDLFIIDAHLKKARQSNEKATHFHKSGRPADAMIQSKLTQIFIHNALARLHCQCEDSSP